MIPAVSASTKFRACPADQSLHPSAAGERRHRLESARLLRGALTETKRARETIDRQRREEGRLTLFHQHEHTLSLILAHTDAPLLPDGRSSCRIVASTRRAGQRVP